MISLGNLSSKQSWELFEPSIIEKIKYVIKLLELYDVENRNIIEPELETLINCLESSTNQIETIFEKFKDIFYSVEKMDSGDWGKERVEERIKEYFQSLIKEPVFCLKSEENIQVEKWNPCQDALNAYIKQCDLNVFEIEKVLNFIRNEIIAKRG